MIREVSGHQVDLSPEKVSTSVRRSRGNSSKHPVIQTKHCIETHSKSHAENWETEWDGEGIEVSL